MITDKNENPKVGDRIRLTQVLEGTVTLVSETGGVVLDSNGPAWALAPHTFHGWTRTAEILERAPEPLPAWIEGDLVEWEDDAPRRLRRRDAEGGWFDSAGLRRHNDRDLHTPEDYRVIVRGGVLQP